MNSVAPLVTATTESQQTHDGKPRGVSTLLYACQQGNVYEVNRILRAQPESVSHRDRTEKTALHYCSTSDNIHAAQAADLLVMAAPDLVETRDEDGFTPLHLAVIAGNIQLVTFLLANKADVNAVDNEKHTVVHWATVCGETEALRAVLAAGAPVSTPDVHGGYPLHYAAQMCGGDKDSTLGLQVLHALLSHPDIRISVQDGDGRQPLLWAASAGSGKAVLALTRAGSIVEAPDKDGLTALHCAASRGHTDCIDTLLNLCGASSDIIDSNGCTALHYAVTLGHADATALLLAHGTDVNRQDRKGRSPAHCGCAKGQFETVKMIGAHGANLWLRNARGDLPLHEAAASGRRDLVKWLLESRPSQVNARNNDGRCPLHLAALNDNADMCKILLDTGAHVNPVLRTSKNVFMTPLDCALQRGFRSTAKYLQLHGGVPANRLNHPRNGQMINSAISLHIRDDITIWNDSSSGSDDDKTKTRKKAVRRRLTLEKKRGALTGTDIDSAKATSAKLHIEKEIIKKVASTGTVITVDRGVGSSNINSARNIRQINKIHKDVGTNVPSQSISDKEDNGEVKPSEEKNDPAKVEKRPKSAKYGKLRGKPERKKGSELESPETQRNKNSPSPSQKDKNNNKAKKVDSEQTKALNMEAGDIIQEVVNEENAIQTHNMLLNTDQQSLVSNTSYEDTDGHQNLLVEASIHSPPKGTHFESASEESDKNEKSIDYQNLEEIDDNETNLKPLVNKQENKVAISQAETDLSKNDLVQQSGHIDQSLVQQTTKSNDKTATTIQQPLEVVNQASEASTTNLEQNQQVITNNDEQIKLTETSKTTASLQQKNDDQNVTIKPEEAIVTEDGETTTDAKHIDVAQVTINETVRNELTEENMENYPQKLQDVPENNKQEKEIVKTEKIQNTSNKEDRAEFMPPAIEKTQIEHKNDVQPTLPNTDALSNVDGTENNELVESSKSLANLEKNETTNNTEIFTDKLLEHSDAIHTEPQTADTSKQQNIANTPLTADNKNEITSEEPNISEQPKNSTVLEKKRKKLRRPEKKVETNFENIQTQIGAEQDQSAKHSKTKKAHTIVLKQVKSTRDSSIEPKSSDEEPSPSSSQSSVLSVTKKEHRSFKVLDESDNENLNERQDAPLKKSRSRSEEKISQHEHLKKSKIPTPILLRRRSKSDQNERQVQSSMESRIPSLPNIVASVDQRGKHRSGSMLSIPLEGAAYSEEDHESEEVTGSTVRKKRLKKRSKTRGSKSAGSGYESSNLIDSGFEPSPRSTKIPKWKNVTERGVNMSSVTQTIQGNIRRYHLERKIFQHLLELKRLQIRSGQHNEPMLVKRAIDAYHKSCASTVGAGKYLQQDYTFKSFEQFLYNSLRKIKKTGSEYLKGLPETPNHPLLCTQSTHRCGHATHAYTGVPCAAYLPKMDHHTIPKIGFDCKPSGFLPKINQPKNAVTLELCHGNDKQIISLPAERLNQNKRYYVTFTVKGNEKSQSGEQNEDERSHRHSKSV